MTYKIITPPTTEPVTLDAALAHLRVDRFGGAHPDEALIEAIIPAAREFCEHYAGRAFAQMTVRQSLSQFPCVDCPLNLELGAVDSVTEIVYTDALGVESTFASEGYALDTFGDARRILLLPDFAWPASSGRTNSVQVEFITTTTCPSAARAAILLMIRHLYDNQSATTDRPVQALTLGAKALLDTLRVWGM